MAGGPEDSDVGQVTTRRDLPPAAAGREVSLRTAKPSRPVAPVIEARGGRAGDDDPTRLLDTRKADRNAPKERRDGERREGERRGTPDARATDLVGKLRREDPPSRAPLVFAIVLALSIAAVVATYLATRG